MEFFDHDDEVVDGVSNDVEVAIRGVTESDVLDVGADISEVVGNVWGDTPGAVWGHAPEPTTEAPKRPLGTPGGQSPE
jgi:hypothetical protein